jgi:subtilisin-like proprotein convertase family protein
MKTRLLILGSAVMLSLTAHAAIITGGAFPDSGYIPDGSAAGSSGTATASGLLPSITDVSVNLNISGGYNGDLYAYLSYGGVLVPLLNRVGVQTTGGAFGYSAGGMIVTLADGYTDIHTVSSPTSSGTYSPDGRQISPLAAPSVFDATGTIGFSAFNGMNPNGTWTLFIADLSSGAQSQLASWSLGIIAEVPEPANVALGIFAGVFLVVSLARSQRVQKLFRRASAHWSQSALRPLSSVLCPRPAATKGLLSTAG